MSIRVSKGEKKYVGGIVSEVNGEDLTSTEFEIGLGTYDDPPEGSDWKTPDISVQGATTAQRVVKLLVTVDTKPLGIYYPWIQIKDNPEQLLERCPQQAVLE